MTALRGVLTVASGSWTAIERTMHLLVTLTRGDIVALLNEALPLTLRLSDPGQPEHFVLLGRPQSVELVANQGLRLETSARIRWEALGVTVPIDVRSVGIMARPEIVLPARDALAFRFEIEHADLKNLPGFVDDALVHRVNAALSAERARLVWPFGRTLGFSLRITSAIEPASICAFQTTSAVLTISPEALSLAVEVHASISRTGAAES